MEGFQNLLDVILLNSSNNLTLAVIIAHTQGIQTGAKLVIHIGLVAAAVFVQREGSLAVSVLDSLQGRSQFIQVGDAQLLGIVIAGSLYLCLIPDNVLALRRILVGRHTINTSAHFAGFPIIFRNGSVQFRSRFLEHIGDIQESTGIDVVVIGVDVGEQDVVFTAGVHNNIAAGVPVAPGDNLHVDVDADLIFQIRVNLCQPCIVVRRHARTNGHPFQGDDVLGGSSRRSSRRGAAAIGAGGGRRGTAAAGCHAEGHGTGHAQRKHFVELFHLFFSFACVKLCIFIPLIGEQNQMWWEN